MGTRSSENNAKGCGSLVVIALVVLFFIGSCAKDAWDDRQRGKRAESEGGGIILVEAPKKTCWFLSAHDERLPDGSLGGDPADEVSSSKRDDLEKSGGEFEQEGCGPAQVTLPSEFIYGSVSVYVGDENDRHNYAAWLWLTSKLIPRGGAISVDGNHQQNHTAVFAAAPAKVYNSNSWTARVTSEEPFGPATTTALDDQAKALLRKAKLNADVFAADRSAAGGQLIASHPGSIDEARAALKKVAAPVAAALDTDFIAFLASGTSTPKEIYEGKPPASVIRIFADMEAAGGSVAAQVPAMRTWFANRILVTISPDYDESTDYFSAAKAVKALPSIDPTQRGRFNSLAVKWKATATSMKAVEEAEKVAEKAELDKLLNAPSGSGWYPGCDGDGDGICFE